MPVPGPDRHHLPDQATSMLTQRRTVILGRREKNRVKKQSMMVRIEALWIKSRKGGNTIARMIRTEGNTNGWMKGKGGNTIAWMKGKGGNAIAWMIRTGNAIVWIARRGGKAAKKSLGNNTQAKKIPDTATMMVTKGGITIVPMKKMAGRKKIPDIVIVRMKRKSGNMIVRMKRIPDTTVRARKTPDMIARVKKTPDMIVRVKKTPDMIVPSKIQDK